MNSAKPIVNAVNIRQYCGLSVRRISLDGKVRVDHGPVTAQKLFVAINQNGGAK